MKTLTLELLRHGPPHNQLLSPLTQYLALCENHAAVTVNVPFEHNQFLHRLRALGYEFGEESRQFQIRDTARVLGDLLGEIPGLIAELNRYSREDGDDGDDAAQNRITHLRLILSASELALLPFELALAPGGFPGAGQHLLLQADQPLCLIREVRRVTKWRSSWPTRPRILFAAAAPRGMAPVPLESHLLAFRALIEPWVGHHENEDERREQIAKHLVVLPEASAQSLGEACADGSFTHVHLLAHGVQYRDDFDVRFGLALHDSGDPYGEPDIVDGERLSTIIRADKVSPTRDNVHPAVVTLASCNSGNVGSVAGAGASVAHALHQSGVPMVVASQFPFSFPGSTIMVEVLYGGLLWGDDPRMTLNNLRRRLHAQMPDTHDWVGVTAYASLLPGFERELTDIRIDQTMRAIDVAMNYADRSTAKLSDRGRGRVAQAALPDQDELQVALDKIETAKRRLEALFEEGGAEHSRLHGLLASTEKRRGEVYFFLSKNAQAAAADYRLESKKSLLNARHSYWQAFLANRSNSWGVVQYLSLDLVLRNATVEGIEGEVPDTGESNDPAALWSLAHVLSLNDLTSAEGPQFEWALGNLVELYMLGLFIPEALAGKGAGREAELTDRATARARELVSHAGANSFEVYSTRRQILRYLEWYQQMSAIGQITNAAEQVFNALPEAYQPAWAS